MGMKSILFTIGGKALAIYTKKKKGAYERGPDCEVLAQYNGSI